MSELKFNVAQLLRENVGAKRHHDFDDPRLPLTKEWTMAPVAGHVKFTRTKSGVWVSTEAAGNVNQVCVRCLTEYQQPIAVNFDEEFHSKIHVTLGTPLPKPEADDAFMIDENHLLDVGDAIREYALLELPLAPLCKEDCKGICPHCGANRNENPCECVDQSVDERMAALKQLLKDS
jgi:uncharacterized protein